MAICENGHSVCDSIVEKLGRPRVHAIHYLYVVFHCFSGFVPSICLSVNALDLRNVMP